MSMRAVTSAPLINFDSKAGKVTFRISPEVEATLLADWILDDDSVPSQLSEFQSYVLRGGKHKRMWCVSISHNTPDTNDGTDMRGYEARAHFVDDKAAGGERDVNKILAALRLIKAERVWTPLVWTVVWSEDGECVGSSAANYGSRWDALEPQIGLDDPFGSDLFPHPYLLEASDIPKLGSLVGEMVHLEAISSMGAMRIRLALKRFSSSYERASKEDDLIDLWVALEALFSREDDQDDERTRRLCRRASSFVEGAPLNTESFLRESYRYRSAVIHGRLPADLPELVMSTEAICRNAIRRALTDVDALRTHLRIR
jgi:hypothetical protein